jgi:Dolichyl-phosphate-mannose-protein mannosyltransferase
MSEPPPTQSRLRAAIYLLVVFIVAFDIAFVWQKATGAYSSEFGAHPDEAAHYVTGLFVRDAIAAAPRCIGAGSLEPLAPFKPDAPAGFYAHYPKVALGVWPPAFYLAQSAWTLPFGESRTSVLLLMAAFAAAIATIIHRTLREDLGEWPAAAAALLWLSTPIVREHYGMVMAEMPGTLTMLGATLVWGRYLDRMRARDAVYFGLLASWAIMTKGTGLALALMAFLSLVITRRWCIFARPALWVSLGIIGVLAGIWTWHFRAEGLRVGGWQDNSGGTSWRFISEAAPFYGTALVASAGIAVAVFALIGVVTSLTRPRGAALASLVAGVFVFQSVIPVGQEARHMIPATPAIIMLAMAGAIQLARHRLCRSPAEPVQRWREKLWPVLLILLAFPGVYSRADERKEWSGFERIAAELIENAPAAARVLVCSDARGEGMFISEIAMREQRPNLIIERASKTLVDPKQRDWGGRHLRPRFPDDEDLLKYLHGGDVAYIVIDEGLPTEKRTGYHDQCFRVVTSSTDTFWKIAESPITRDGVAQWPPVRLYRIRREPRL